MLSSESNVVSEEQERKNENREVRVKRQDHIISKT